MHQYIKILTMCLSVCVQWKWDVRGAGLDYSDVRPSYFEPLTPRRMFENSGHGRNLPGQLAWSSSQSRRNPALTHCPFIMAPLNPTSLMADLDTSIGSSS